MNDITPAPGTEPSLETPAPMPEMSMPTPTPTPMATAPVGVANSANGALPDELRGWNWGAFGLTYIWGIGHGVWMSLLMFIPVVNIIMWFVLGAKGTEWAWNARPYSSVEEFKAVEKTWKTAGLATFIIGLVAFVIVLVSEGLIFAAIANYSTKNTSATNDASLNSLYSNYPTATPAPADGVSAITPPPLGY